MKATHKSKSNMYQDRVFHLVDGTSTVFVQINGLPWKESAWSGDLVRFNIEMVKLSTFKGNK